MWQDDVEGDLQRLATICGVSVRVQSGGMFGPVIMENPLQSTFKDLSITKGNRGQDFLCDLRHGGRAWYNAMFTGDAKSINRAFYELIVGVVEKSATTDDCRSKIQLILGHPWMKHVFHESYPEYPYDKAAKEIMDICLQENRRLHPFRMFSKVDWSWVFEYVVPILSTILGIIYFIYWLATR